MIQIHDHYISQDNVYNQKNYFFKPKFEYGEIRDKTPDVGRGQ